MGYSVEHLVTVRGLISDLFQFRDRFNPWDLRCEQAYAWMIIPTICNEVEIKSSLVHIIADFIKQNLVHFRIALRQQREESISGASSTTTTTLQRFSTLPVCVVEQILSLFSLCEVEDAVFLFRSYFELKFPNLVEQAQQQQQQQQSQQTESDEDVDTFTQLVRDHYWQTNSGYLRYHFERNKLDFYYTGIEKIVTETGLDVVVDALQRHEWMMLPRLRVDKDHTESSDCWDYDDCPEWLLEDFPGIDHVMLEQFLENNYTPPEGSAWQPFFEDDIQTPAVSRSDRLLKRGGYYGSNNNFE